MSIIGVYAIANTANKKVYVGASRDINSRFSVHKAELRKGQHKCTSLQEDWNNSGGSCFKFMILELSDVKNYVLVERKYIKGFASLNKDCLYNKLNVPKEPKITNALKQPRRTGRYSQKSE